MPKLNLQFTILLPMLLILVLPGGSDVQPKDRRIADMDTRVALPIKENPTPCAELKVTNSGAVCKSRFGLVADLDFPEVDLKSVLAGGEYLPQAKSIFTPDEKTVDGKSYQNIAFELRWEPNTPEFLQIYLNEYLPYWGNRVPYRLFWSARYDVCPIENCTEWVTVNEKGEFLPPDVNDLQDDLAADVNFNGVPAAFWNSNVNP